MAPILPPKKFLFGAPARSKLLDGIDLMRKAVTATLGPNGRNVAIDRYMVIDLTKDGVTVLADVTSEDQFEEMGCKMVREASTKTNDDAGDGTTTAIELSWAMCMEGSKHIRSGTNVIKLQTGMQKAIDIVVAELEKQAVVVNNDRQRYIDVATISAQDVEIGEKIADIFLQSGENGVIDIERVDKPGIETEHTDGMQLGEGWLRPEFINDWTNRTFGMDEIPVVVTDRELTANVELQFLEQLAKKGIKKALIVCDDCNGEALGTLVKNARFGAFHSCVVKAPGWGQRKMEILKDIAAMTGATVISEENGLNLDEIQLSHIGRARQVTVHQKKTILVADQEHEAFNPIDGTKTPVKTLVANRVTQLNQEIEQADEGFEKEKMKERLASMTDGVSIVKLGGTTEIERILMKRRVEDAIRAVQCAKEEGIVIGGGAALLKCVPALEDISLDDPDEQAGLEIVKAAIQSPARRILDVAGTEPDPAPFLFRLLPSLRARWTRRCQDKILEAVKDRGSRYGYDMSQPGYVFVDLFAKGVVDPKKVVRVALQNAASCAKSYLSTEVAISPIREQDPAFAQKKS